jgi:hypothetical protein
MGKLVLVVACAGMLATIFAMTYWVFPITVAAVVLSVPCWIVMHVRTRG